MNDFVREFGGFLVQAVISYALIRLLLILISVRIVRVSVDVPAQAIPITVEAIGDQFYCYDKNKNSFLAQGRDRDEIVELLTKQYPNHTIYVDGGDPADIKRFLENK